MRNSRRLRNCNGMRPFAELASDLPEPIRIGATMIRSGIDVTTALAGGYHFAWLVGAGIVVITLAVSGWLLRSQTVADVAPDESCVGCEAAA